MAKIQITAGQMEHLDRAAGMITDNQRCRSWAFRSTPAGLIAGAIRAQIGLDTRSNGYIVDAAGRAVARGYLDMIDRRREIFECEEERGM